MDGHSEPERFWHEVRLVAAGQAKIEPVAPYPSAEEIGLQAMALIEDALERGWLRGDAVHDLTIGAVRMPVDGVRATARYEGGATALKRLSLSMAMRGADKGDAWELTQFQRAAERNDYEVARVDVAKRLMQLQADISAGAN
jgi:hypothetical protein